MVAGHTMAKLVWKIILDFVILACVAFPLLALLLWAEPYRRGYFAADLSLRLPYRAQTVSEGLLAGAGFGLVVLTVVIVEVVRDKRGAGGERWAGGGRWAAAGWVRASYAAVGAFTFGAAGQQLAANAAKYVVGRLRPHFHHVCEPTPSSPPAPYEYIEQYECAASATSASAALLRDMRLSFPSAHASFAMYTAVFFILYLQVRWSWRGSALLRPAAQLAALLAAWYVGLSRVVDHMHHATDVAAGFGIGAALALLVFVYVLKPRRHGDGGGGAAAALWPELAASSALPRPVLAQPPMHHTNNL